MNRYYKELLLHYAVPFAVMIAVTFGIYWFALRPADLAAERKRQHYLGLVEPLRQALIQLNADLRAGQMDYDEYVLRMKPIDAQFDQCLSALTEDQKKLRSFSSLQAAVAHYRDAGKMWKYLTQGPFTFEAPLQYQMKELSVKSSTAEKKMVQAWLAASDDLDKAKAALAKEK